MVLSEFPTLRLKSANCLSAPVLRRGRGSVRTYLCFYHVRSSDDFPALSGSCPLLWANLKVSLMALALRPRYGYCADRISGGSSCGLCSRDPTAHFVNVPQVSPPCSAFFRRSSPPQLRLSGRAFVPHTINNFLSRARLAAADGLTATHEA